MVNPAQSESSSRRFVVWFAVAAVHLTLAAASVLVGGMNPDEGFYAAAARAVMAGDVPYRDFGYTQMPLLPYVNGPLLSLAGYGLLAQRAVNGAWGVLTLGLAGLWLARRCGLRPAVATVLLFSVNPAWMYFNHLGKTYAFTGLIAMGAAVLHLELRPGWRKCALIGAVGVLGLGCRLPAAPFFALLWIAAGLEMWRHASGPRWPAVVVPLGAALALLGPFWLAAPDQFRFWVLEFHRVSLPSKSWQVGWLDHLTLAPAVWVAAAVALVAWLVRPGWSRPVAVGGAALVALAANLLPRGTYEEYAVPFLPVLGLAVAALLAGLSRRRLAALVAVLVGVQILVPPAVSWNTQPARRWTPSAWLTANSPDYEPDLPGQLARVRSTVRHFAGPGGAIAGSNLIVATETSRPVGPDLRMGPFTATAEMPAARAAQMHLATPAALKAQFADPRTRVLAFFNRPLLNYAWSMPSFGNIPVADRQEWVEIFRRDYDVVLQEGDFLLFARRPVNAPAAPLP